MVESCRIVSRPALLYEYNVQHAEWFQYWLGENRPEARCEKGWGASMVHGRLTYLAPYADYVCYPSQQSLYEGACRKLRMRESRSTFPL